MDATKKIDKRIAETKDWRGKRMAQIRKLIHEADAEIVEEWKWDSPVFTHHGLVCAVSAFKGHVGVNFFKGASVKDAKKLFNGGLDAKTMRTINLKEKDALDQKAFKDPVKAAVAFNLKK
ncbi:MAG: DUF1801 domain-containing protein [Anaerolineales bacterium]